MASKGERLPAKVCGTPRVIDLGTVRISGKTYAPRPASGARLLIQRDTASTPGRYYHLSLTVHGTTGVSQLGREAWCRAGDLVLYDPSRSFRRWVAEGEVAGAVVVCVPAFVLPLPTERIDALLAMCLPGNEGIGALLKWFLMWLTADTAAYRPVDAAFLEPVLLDLLTALLARCLVGSSPPAAFSTTTLLVRVQAYARRHLRDPRLSPQTIADAHHISVRYLHRLFRERGLTVASWVREQRLERCRRDLIDPGLSSQPIYAIAKQWGFPRPPDFSRAFRARYGMTPREYRRETPL